MYDNIADEFLSQRNPLYQAAKASRYAQPLEEEEDPLPAPKSLKEQAEEKVNSGLLRKVGSTALSGIAAAGNLLDLPGSMVRDVASWAPGGTKAQNPFDQVLDPFGKNASENRIEGRELLRNSGLIRKKNNWGNFMGGMAMEMALDPTTFFGTNVLGKAGKAFEKAGLTKNIKGMVNEIAEMNGKLPSKLGGVGWKTHFTGGRALEHIQNLRDHVAKNDVARVMAGKMVANGTKFNSLDELKELEGLKDLNWGVVDDGSGYRVYQYEIPEVAEGAKAKADEVAGEWKLNENATDKFREIINGKSVNMTYGRAKALVKDNYEKTYGGSFEEALDQPLYSFLSFKVPFAEGTRTPLIKSATPDEWWNRRMEKLQDAPAKEATAPPVDADISGRSASDAAINPNAPKAPQVDAAKGVTDNQATAPAVDPATSGHPGDVSSTGDNVSPTSPISETLAKDLNITPDTPRGRVLSQLIPLQDEAYTRAQVPVMDALAKNLSKLRGESEDSVWESLSYLQANNKGELDKLMKDGGKWDELFQEANQKSALYYNIDNVLDSKVGGKTSWEQLKATAKKAGVKDEELEDLNLEALFKDGKPKTKAEIKEWVDGNKVDIEVVENNRYEGYQVPGGDTGTYRELLIKTPVPPSVMPTLEDFINNGTVVVEKDGDEWQAVVTKGYYAGEALSYGKKSKVEAVEAAREGSRRLLGELELATRRGGGYKGPHFDQPNIVAHARVDDVTLPNGKKAMRVQEVQSDWHQKGKKDGYASEGFNPKWKQEGDSVSFEYNSPNGYTAYAKISPSEGGKYVIEIDGDDLGYRLDSIDEAKSQAIDSLGDYTGHIVSESMGVPDGPFKKSWSTLALKHILKEAAEKGYDEVMIVKGSDAAKSVGGPEAALSTFYDSILHNDMKKLTKKWGSFQGTGNLHSASGTVGAWEKLSDTYHKLSSGSLPFSANVVKIKNSNEWQARFYIDEVGEDVIGNFKSMDEAKQAAASYMKEEIAQHGLDNHGFSGDVQVFKITPEMRADLLEKGQALYQDKGKAARGMILSQGSKHIISLFTGKADFSTNLHELAHFSRKMLSEELQAKATAGVKELLGGKSVTTKGGKWTVEAEEAFAKEFENYLLKGDAPNAALKDVFEKIKEFMLQVYKSLAGQPIDINPKLKEVFDTILGKEEGLAKKADAPAPRPLPALATPAPIAAAPTTPATAVTPTPAGTSTPAVSAPAKVASAPANVNPIVKVSKRPGKKAAENPVVDNLLKSLNRARPLDTAEAAAARKEVEQAAALPIEERANAFQQIAAKWKKPVEVVNAPNALSKAAAEPVAKASDTPAKVNDALTEAVKGTPIGEGGNARVYAIDDTSVVRVPKYTKGDIKDDFKPVEHPLTKLGIKVGQATAENSQGVQILQRQRGIEAGLATPRLVPEELRDATYEKSVLLAAGMPDEAYDEFANTLKALDEAGYQFDPSKSSNILIDEDAGKFNLVDVNESKSGKPQASLEYMLIPLMGNTYAHQYKGMDLTSAYRMIHDKATDAARKAGIKLELGSSGKYSLELAGLPAKAPPTSTNPLITAAKAGYPDITPQKTEATTAPSGSFLRSRKRELEQKIEDAGEFDLNDELPALQRQLDEVNAQLKDSAPAPRQAEPELDPELEAIEAWEPGKVSDNVSPTPKELLATRGKEAAQEAAGIAPDEAPPETPPVAQLAPELKPGAAETPTTEDLLTRWIRSNKRDKGYIGTFRDSQGLSPEQMDALHDAMKKDARFERQKDGGYYPTSEAIANVTKEDNERLAWLTTQSLDSATIGEPVETYRKGDYRDGKGFATDPEFAASEFAKRKNAHLPNGHPRQYAAQKVDDNTWTVVAEEVSTPSTPPVTAPVGVNPLIAAAKEAPAALPAETWELDGEDYMMGDWMLSPEKAGYRVFKNGVKQPQVGSLEKMQAFAESQAPSNPLLAKARPREGDEFFVNPDKAEKPPTELPAAASPKAPTEAMSPEKVAVLEEHHDFIQNIARSKTKDANEADDLAQDVRIKLAKKMDDPEFDLKDVRGWIATTARTTNIDNIRRRARQAELVGDGLELAAAKDAGRMAKSAMVMDRILDIVPENVQNLLRMRHQEGLTTAQIAERLLAETGEKVSVDALNKRMSRVWTETQEIVSDTARLEKAKNITDAERAAAQASIDERLANLRAGSPKSDAIEQIKELDVDKLFQEPNKLEADFNEKAGKQVPAPLLRDAAKAAADAAAEVRGLASKGTNASEPEWLDDVMDAIDKGEHLFFNNPVMLRAAALFDRTTYGGITEEEQKVARMAAKEHEESQYQFREMLTGIVRVIAKTGYLDEAPLIKAAADTSKQGARKAARAIMNQRHGEIRKFLETKTDNPMELYLDGDIFKDAGTRALIEDQLRLMRKIMPEELRKDALAGITTPALRDEGVDYFPREEYSFGGPRSKSERNEIVFGTRSKHQSKRAASRKNIKEGTAVLDDMSLDPNISGKYWQQPMLGKGVDSVDEDAKYIQEKYGDRILLDSDYDEFTDGSREINRKGKSKLKRIASDIATLNPEHVNKQIPLYGYNFLHDFARRVEDGYAKRGVARAAQQLAIQNISVGQQYGIGKYFETIKLDNPNAYRNVINGAGHGEQYDAYLKTELEKFKSELKEKAEKAAKDTPDASPHVEYEKDDITYRLDGDKVFIVSHLEDGEEILEELAGDLFDKKIEESLNLPKRYATKVANRGAGFSVSREVYEGGTRFLKPWTTPSEVGMAKSVFRAALNFWKSHLTLPFPQFHGRNGISGQIQNFFYGAFDNASGKSLPQNPLKLMNQARVLRGGHAIKGIYNELPKPIRDIIDTTSTDTDLDKKATEWLQNRIFKWGFTSDKQGIAAERLGDSASNIMSQMPGLSPPKGPLGIFRNPSGDATWSDMFNPTEILGGGRPVRVPIEDSAVGDLVGKANPQKMKWTWRTPEESNFIPVRAGEDVAQYMEDINRTTAFLGFLKQGFDEQEAARKTLAIHFDYSNLSEFEKGLKNFIPFYVFTSKVVPLTFGDLFRNPGGKQAWAIRATTRAQDEETPAPDNVLRSTAIPLGETATGADRYLTGLGLGFEDALSFTGALRGDVRGTASEIVSRLRPEIQATGELATGRSLFFDKELNDLDPQVGRLASNIRANITGERPDGQADPILGSRGLEFLLGKSPLSRYVNTANNLLDTRKNAGYKFLNTATGVKVTDVEPWQKDRTNIDRASELLKGMGAKTSTLTYLPQWKKDRMSPEELEQANEIQAWISGIQKGGRERKKAEDAANGEVESVNPRSAAVKKAALTTIMQELRQAAAQDREALQAEALDLANGIGDRDFAKKTLGPLLFKESERIRAEKKKQRDKEAMDSWLGEFQARGAARRKNSESLAASMSAGLGDD